MKGLNLGKYRVIVISVALFLVFDLGVLILNFYISSEISKDAVAVNLAGRQRMLTQRMTKSLLDIQNKELVGGNTVDNQKELKNTYELFDETLASFRDGGEAKGGDGSLVLLDKIDQPDGLAILDDAYEIWKPYKLNLLPVIQTEKISTSGLTNSVDYARENNLSLLRLMNDLTTFLEKKATQKASFLRLIQVVGISLATINFIIILFHFIKGLRKNDILLEEAKQETDEILATVNEGLFLLNEDYTIGSQYSKELEKIFNTNRLEGINFKRFLSKIVPEKSLQVAVDYIDLLFGDRVNEKLVESLNPLDKVEVFFSEDNGEYYTLYLTFTFNRVLNESGISHLLVTVSDITKQVELEKSLQHAEEKSKDQLNLLTEVLPMEPQALNNFLSNAKGQLDEVNKELKRNNRDDSEYVEKVNVIFRHIHRLKGDSAALGFRYMQKEAHQFEKSLVELRDMPRLTGNDFLPLAIELKKMYALLESVDNLFNKLGAIKVAVKKEIETAQEGSHHWDELKVFTRELAGKHNKKVKLELGTFDESFPDEYTSPLRELLIQLIRNSIVHGIEDIDSRGIAGKREEGLIKVKLKNVQDNFEFTYQDDGSGFDPIKIRRAAVRKGLYDEKSASHLDESQLVKLLFTPGFSTTESPDEDSGQGVGMDVIRTMVNEIGGKLRVSSSPGKHCRFTVIIPAFNKVKGAA